MISSLLQLLCIYRKSSQERKQFYYGNLYGKCCPLFDIRNLLGIARIIFQHYHPGYFMADAVQNLH